MGHEFWAYVEFNVWNIQIQLRTVENKRNNIIRVPFRLSEERMSVLIQNIFHVTEVLVYVHKIKTYKFCNKNWMGNKTF